MVFLIMMMLSLGSTSSASANESWLCTDESSQIQGTSILSCGIGLANDEDTARAKAFYAAKAEFDRICDASTTCKGKEVKVEPKRTTCAPDGEKYKCHRLIVFTVGVLDAKVVQARAKAKTIAAQKDYNVNDFFRDWSNANLRPPDQ